MLDVLTLLAAALIGYLVGSFPAGYLLGRLWGVDVLKKGSGRTGGTNVFRSAGIIPALITGGLDIGKGALAVWLAGQVAQGSNVVAAQILGGAAVILGHNYSVFLHFRGGAGVGTSLGALSMVYWPAALVLVALLFLIIAISRYASLGSLIVITMMPIILFVVSMLGILPIAYVFYGILAWAIVVYAHRPNIQRLIEGTERRLGGRGRRIP